MWYVFKNFPNLLKKKKAKNNGNKPALAGNRTRGPSSRLFWRLWQRWILPLNHQCLLIVKIPNIGIYWILTLSNAKNKAAAIGLIIEHKVRSTLRQTQSSAKKSTVFLVGSSLKLTRRTEKAHLSRHRAPS